MTTPKPAPDLFIALEALQATLESVKPAPDNNDNLMALALMLAGITAPLNLEVKK